MRFIDCTKNYQKESIGGGFQNGFAFFENGLGFNFKSIDKMIEDINDQFLQKRQINTENQDCIVIHIVLSGDDGTMTIQNQCLNLSKERNFGRFEAWCMVWI